ncbi:hypothetical protein JCM16814_19620 [Desulfobaculum senezii]
MRKKRRRVMWARQTARVAGAKRRAARRRLLEVRSLLSMQPPGMPFGSDWKRQHTSMPEYAIGARGKEMCGDIFRHLCSGRKMAEAGHGPWTMPRLGVGGEEEI